MMQKLPPRAALALTLTFGLILSILARSGVAQTDAAQADAAPLVRVVPLAELLLYPEASAPASVVSLADSRISAEMNGVVAGIRARVGDAVSADDTLATLDCTDLALRGDELDARLRALDARVDFASKQVNRAQALERKRTLAQEAVEQRRSELATLRAERDAQRALLAINARDRDKCALRAPFDAVVVERLVSPGEYVMPGTPLLRLLDVDRVEVSGAVLARDAASLAVVEGALFRYAGADHPLRLRVLLPSVDVATRTREARLNFADSAGVAPPPGAAGRLVWRQPAALPADYISRRDGRLGVLLADKNDNSGDGDAIRARFMPLPGASQGRPASIELAPATLVITDGRLGLSDGDPVRIAD